MLLVGSSKDEYTPALTLAEWRRSKQDIWRMRFESDIESMVGFDAVNVGIARVGVLPGLVFVGRRSAVCDEDITPLAGFLAPLATGKTPRPATNKAPVAPKASVAAELIKQYPWLEGMLADSSPGGSSSAGAGSTHRPEDNDRGLDDERLLLMFAELERKRATETPVEIAPQSFRTKLLGSRWLIREKAKPADAWQGAARTSQAEAWCRRYGLTKSARFEITLYGNANAILIARSWRHKMEYFYKKWMAAGCGKYQYSENDVEVYEEPQEFTQAVQGLSGQQSARVAQIRALVPR